MDGGRKMTRATAGSSKSSGSGMSGKNEDKKETELLFLLPKEILEKVLDYLDAPALLNLRLTSKRTKAVVEQEKYLEKIPVYLKPNKISSVLSQLISSTIPWTNFTIDVSVMAASGNFPKFASKYAPTMKVCCLYGKGNQDRIRGFLSKLTSLHTFEIRNLPLTLYFYGERGAFRAKEKEDKAIKENLERVRIFRISLDFDIYPEPDDDGNDTHLDLDFLLYLKHSSNLRRVELKHELLPPDVERRFGDSDDDSDEDLSDRYPPMHLSLFIILYKFLVLSRPQDGDPKYSSAYFGPREDWTTSLNRDPLDIHFRGIDVIDSTGKKFEKCRKEFLRIVGKCHGVNVKLHNVPCYLLALDTPELSEVQRTKYDTCLISLSGELAEYRQRENIYIPSKFVQ